MIHDVQLPVADRETYVFYLKREREREMWWVEESERERGSG